MIFLLREMFKRQGWDGYNASHHYADLGITAGAGAAIALAIGTDTESSRYYFENSVFFAAAGSLMLSFRTVTASEPDTKSPRITPYLTKLVSGAVLGMAIAATPLVTLPGPEGSSLRERILQDNQDYVLLRKRQKALEKELLNNVSHETIENTAPQKRGLGL